ncbi:MAG: hypothetical protein JWQ47_2836 [Glaciihabitans sp.]|nr:hypothetical protein [Glaciihabitans sp.]
MTATQTPAHIPTPTPTPNQAPQQGQRKYVGSEQSEVVTPRIRTTARRLAFWLGAIVIVAIIVLAILLLTAPTPSTARLSATNPKPVGAKALIEVLRTDGVHVDSPRTLDRAVADLGSGSSGYGANPTATTLVLYDPNSILSRTQLRELPNVTNLVLIEPSFAELSELAPTISSAGFVSSGAKAGCDFGPAERAGTVAGLDKGYRIASGPDVTGAEPIHCFAGSSSSSASYSLIRTNTGTSTVTVLGSTSVLENGSITRAGNAALALGLFGETKNLVWYLPSLSDYTVAQDGIIPVPPWVTLAITLAGLVVLAAAFWRGRRLGPVVIERLPVVVRSSETVEGRARLYQKASSRTHALDGLRIGTLTRLAVLCGLPKRASLDDVIGAVARETGRPAPELRALLVDDIPRTDADLVRASDDLLRLEREVAAATRPA